MSRSEPAGFTTASHIARHRAGLRIADAGGLVWEVDGVCGSCGYCGPVCDIILGTPHGRRLYGPCALGWVFPGE